jgi:HlyD family secretion protein
LAAIVGYIGPEIMTQTNAPLPDFLQTAKPGILSGRRRWLLLAVVVVIVVVWLLLPSGSQQQGRYLTEEATTGKLVVTISASGTLQPTRSVDVGSELSGTLDAVLVNENDRVTKGQVVARLDTSKLEDAVVKSRAALALAEATVAESRANLKRLRHVAELSGGKVPSQSELETADATLLRAEANATSASATLKSDETNIVKATIRSPINGVVLTRKVEPGQTVVAAMTTPVLFVLAEDLTKMELQVKVDEADVGTVKLGQNATFSVSAWPGRNFPATIMRVGVGSTTTDNVVTYKTVLAVKNDDLALRPGMTATARITTANRDNVLLVPNAALRYTPATDATPVPSGSFISKLMPRPPMPKTQQPKAAQSGTAQVWVLSDGQPVAVPVQAGASNGRQTEITGGGLKAGMAVITDYEEGKQ